MDKKYWPWMFLAAGAGVTAWWFAWGFKVGRQQRALQRMEQPTETYVPEPSYGPPPPATYQAPGYNASQYV
jgi:hypothetical protein